MNPIIFLCAHPRSMSTAIERIMRERGDLDCLHEPFLHYYYFWQTLGLDYSASALNWDQESSPEDWQYVSGWHQAVMASSGISASSKTD